MASPVVDDIARRMLSWIEENFDCCPASRVDTESPRDRDDDVLMTDAPMEDTCSRGCGLGLLSSELVHCIADHLKTRDLVYFASTCRGFYTLLRSSLHRELHRVALARPEDYDVFVDYKEKPPQLRHFSWDIRPPSPAPGLFFDAITYGRPRAVQSFLEHGVDPDSYNLCGIRPLRLALGSDFQREFIYLLLKFGANPSLSDLCDVNSTPLYNASVEADSDTARWFMAAGADVTQPNVIHALAQFCSAKAFRIAVARGANIHEIDGAGGNILHSAARNDDWHVLKFLLEEQGMGHLVNSVNRRGKTPLLKAVEAGNHDIVEQLLKHGANPNVRHGGCTPLMVAVPLDGPRSVELLIEKGAHVNARDADGATALHKAAVLALTDVVPMLLDAGANPDVQDVRGETPLHHALGPDPCGTVCTETPEQKDVVSLLLMAGADRSIGANVGDTAFDRARRFGYLERAYLLETGEPNAFNGPPPSHFLWHKFLNAHYEIPDWYHPDESSTDESSTDEADWDKADHDEDMPDSDENLDGDEDGDEAGDEAGDEDGDEYGHEDGDEDGDEYGDEYGDWDGDEHGDEYGDEHGDEHGDGEGDGNVADSEEAMADA